MTVKSKEQIILDAAEELFLEKGYKMATTTAIAAKAGMTHAMLHYYFRTKEQIFLHIFDKNVKDMFQCLFSAMSPDLSVWEILKEVLDRHYEYLCRHPQLPFLFLDVVKNNPEIFNKYREELVEVVKSEMKKHRDRFKAEVDAGRINDVDPVALLYGMMAGNVSGFLSIPFLKNVAGLDEQQIADFLKGIKDESLKSLYARLHCKDIPEML